MAKYVIHSDKGPIILRKSKKLVGLKLRPTRSTQDQEFIKEELHKHLGGFKLVELETEGQVVDDKLDEVREDETVEVGTHVYYAEGSDTPVIPTGEIAITFEDGVSVEEQEIALDEFALELLERRSPVFLIAQVTPNSPNPIKVAQALQATSLVKVAEPDLDILLDDYDVIPNDHLFRQQWQLRNSGRVPDARVRLRPGADAKIVEAWRTLGNYGDNDITIAVIDTGFDLTHPDLKSKVFRPYDIWNNSPQVSQGDPRYVHGTPCASVALAAANSSGIVGAAPNARFMPVNGTSFSDRLTETMFNYCVRNGADIISCSWGTTNPHHRLNYRKEQAIERAATQGRNGKGCVILFAAGNESKPYINYYAAHPNVIAVSACTSQDRHATYSNQGPEVTVCAPSSGDWPILAARAWWDEGYSGEQGHFRYYIDGVSRGNNYKHFGGTSSSTPLVAGICALILSANPELTGAEVKEILIQTADKIGHPSEYVRGHSRKYGYGRVNAERAVAEAIRRRGNALSRPETPSSTPSTPSAGSGPSGGLFEVSVKDEVKIGWGVQIGAYSNYDGVMSLVNQLERSYRQPVHVQTVNSGGRVFYRVIVGAFPDINDARELQHRLQNAGYTNAFIKNLRDI